VSRLRRPSPALVVASLALLLALGGVTYASIPGPDGTIHSCVDARGAVRVVDSSATCNSSEQALDFAQTGPTGPAGPQGAAGPSGQSRLLDFAQNVSAKVPRKAGTPVGSFMLPAGNWVLTLNGRVDIPSSQPFALGTQRGGKLRGVAGGPDVSCRVALGDGSVRQVMGNGGLIGLLVPAVQSQHGAGGGGGTGRVQHTAFDLRLVHDVPAGGERGFLACVQGKPGAGLQAPAAVVSDVSVVAVPVDQVGALDFTPGR
jgi:hypothetical protein